MTSAPFINRKQIQLGIPVMLALICWAVLILPLQAERSLPAVNAQDVFYSVNASRRSVEFALLSQTELPGIRYDFLDNREGFVLHFSRQVKLQLQSLAETGPLFVLPTQDAMSVVVLTSGINQVMRTDIDKNKVSFVISTGSDEWEKFVSEKRQRLGNTQQVARVVRGSAGEDSFFDRSDVSPTPSTKRDPLESRALLQASPDRAPLGANEHVLLRGRVIASVSMGELMQLPNVTPRYPLSTYLDAAINPPGADVVYLPGTTVTGGNPDHDIFLGYKVGPGSFRPYVTFLYEHDSNLYGRNTNVVASDSFTVSPILEYEIPGETRDFRIAYNPVFRWITNFSQPSHISHFLNFDSRVELSDRIRFALRDHFARGIFETLEFDPGRELNFSASPYFRNDVGAEVGIDLSEKNQLIGDADFDRVVFDQRFNDTFFNFDTYSFSAGWLRDQWATANFFLRYTYMRTLTSGTNAAGRNGTENSYEFGLNKAFTDRTSGNFTVGYRETAYDNHGLANFHSWIARASLTKQFNDRNSIDIAAMRGSSQSAFGNNSFFVSNGLRGRYQWRGDRFTLAFTGGYQRNNYPENSLFVSTIDGSTVITTGPRRHDSLYDAGADLGVVLNNKMVLIFGYAFEKRTANLGDPFNYNRHLFHVGFNLGRVSSGEGSQVYQRQSAYGLQQ
jgi:hypothetical protein